MSDPTPNPPEAFGPSPQPPFLGEGPDEGDANVPRLRIPRKTWPENRIRNLEENLRLEGVDAELAARLSRAWARSDEQATLDEEANYRAIELWANQARDEMHVIGGGGGGGETLASKVIAHHEPYYWDAPGSAPASLWMDEYVGISRALGSTGWAIEDFGDIPPKLRLARGVYLIRVFVQLDTPVHGLIFYGLRIPVVSYAIPDFHYASAHFWWAPTGEQWPVSWQLLFEQSVTTEPEIEYAEMEIVRTNNIPFYDPNVS